ncbi:hypothetical protein [Candidatus Rhabdochlamydia sp. T3358]|uniref:hypothetical protein n=1 Tax=Candidatus Rhabdochlamydia sp. T3358 TaxID=2099795 RepID=UPI0010B5AE5A|nr:hypothetical protein [Candidatus Rhabdochlamydia sp. T3358]VHO03141.1 hypothetical protein RHT_00756 [Candidatus Rhabdochlamydia sp. T3358]
MSLPISGSGVSPAGSSGELYPSGTSSAISPCTILGRYGSQLNWDPSPGGVANYVADRFKEGKVHHNFSHAEAQEFVSAMRAAQKPIGNKITRNPQKKTSTIQFRPKHGLSDIHGLGIFLEQKGGFAGCNVAVEKKHIVNAEELSHSSINIRNYQDVVGQKYKQLWEDRAPENSEEYKVPDSGYYASTIWPEKKKTVDQLEKQLSYQKRLFQRAINIMNNKQKESDKEIPFDPAFTRIFQLTDKERRVNKMALSIIARATSIYFEYKTKVVPLKEEEACIAEVNNMPTCTIDQICDAIEADLRARPIEIVDLHKISHLLEQLGGFASSSACVEREYTIGGKECHCTAIILRNRQDLVNERYFQLWDTYGLQHDLSQIPPKCDYPVSLFQKKKTPKEADEQLIYQKELLQKAVEKMYIEGVPFDPLFARVYIPTDQERIDNGASIFNIAQTDTILFVYAKSENKDLPLHAVDQICEAIKTMAADKFPAVNTAETSAIGTTLKVAGRVAGFFLPPQGRY